jgi:hypothetical protein
MDAKDALTEDIAIAIKYRQSRINHGRGRGTWWVSHKFHAPTSANTAENGTWNSGPNKLDGDDSNMMITATAT